MWKRQVVLVGFALMVSVAPVLNAYQGKNSEPQHNENEHSELTRKTRALLSIIILFNQTEVILKESKEKATGDLLNSVKKFSSELSDDDGNERVKISKDAKAPLRISWIEGDKKKFRRLILSNSLFNEYLNGSQYTMSLLVRELIRTDSLDQGDKESEAVKKAVLAQSFFLTAATARRATSDKRVKEILDAKTKGEASPEFRAALKKAASGRYEARTGDFKSEFEENLDEVDGLLRKLGIRLLRKPERSKKNGPSTFYFFPG